MQGDKFTRELLRPIAPAALFQLVQAGYPVDLVFQLATRAINGVYNRSTRPTWTREADPAFYPLLDALRRLQVSETIDFRLEKRGPEDTALIAFRGGKVTPAVEQDSRFVRTALGLPPDARELNLTFGAIPRNDRELAVLTRSMLEILLELAGQVAVPDPDLADGRALRVPPPDPASGPHDLPLVNIHTGTEPPPDAFVAVRYSQHGFWIDNRDFRSKAVFSFLLLLTALAQTGVTPQTPVLTVPAG